MEEGNTVSVQCSNSPLLVMNNAIQLFNEHWYSGVKNTEVHDGTLNVLWQSDCQILTMW